jgi:hypothetical protein
LHLTPDDWERAFFGTVPEPEHGFISVKRVVRAGASWLALRPHDLVVFQAVLSDPKSGRYMLVETAAGELLENELAPETSACLRVRPLVNGFVLEPFAGNRTKVTSLRSEEFAASGFIIPSI